MIYTADMVASAVESASKSARAAGAAHERERICNVLAGWAEATDNAGARDVLWEIIGTLLEREVAS
jgi:hypothetical protein